MKLIPPSLLRLGLWLVPMLLIACSDKEEPRKDAGTADAAPARNDASPVGADATPDVAPGKTDASPDNAPDSTPGKTDASPDNAPDSTPGKTDASPDTTTDSTPGKTDASPDTTTDATPSLTDATPDGSPAEVFVPPMPSVTEDATLTDTTDFGTSAGFKIIIDYRYDTAQYFSRERRLVLRTAAASWEQFIGSDFTAIPPNTSIRARDPENPDAGGINFTVSYPIDDLVIFVGASTIDGPGGTLGTAFSSATYPAELAEQLMARYKGNPYQPWVATIRFDSEDTFFFDATMATSDDLAKDKVDFYSVALHEMGHVLGIGQGAAYTALVSNATFTGAHAVALYGAPVPLTSDGAHVLKTVLVDGRRVVMDESDAMGQRSLITRLELAMLEDLGYQIRR